jgi:hypothetical protein
MFHIVIFVENKIKVKLHCHNKEKYERQRNSICFSNGVSDEVIKFSKFQS